MRNAALINEKENGKNKWGIVFPTKKGELQRTVFFNDKEMKQVIEVVNKIKSF